MLRMLCCVLRDRGALNNIGLSFVVVVVMVLLLWESLLKRVTSWEMRTLRKPPEWYELNRVLLVPRLACCP